MDKAFFGLQIDKLRGVYSAASMNEHRVLLFWDRFKSVENHVFENAVNWLIGEATTQQLPAMSRFAEAMGMFRTNPNGAVMQDFLPAWNCEKCRDFGYRFEGEIVVACQCATGRGIGPTYLAKQQGFFDSGKRFLKSPAASFFPSLPYDPNEREGA